MAGALWSSCWSKHRRTEGITQKVGAGFETNNSSEVAAVGKDKQECGQQGRPWEDLRRGACRLVAAQDNVRFRGAKAHAPHWTTGSCPHLPAPPASNAEGTRQTMVTCVGEALAAGTKARVTSPVQALTQHPVSNVGH